MSERTKAVSRWILRDRCRECFVGPFRIQLSFNLREVCVGVVFVGRGTLLLYPLPFIAVVIERTKTKVFAP